MNAPTRTSFVLLASFLIAACAPAEPETDTLTLIKQWVDGYYNNVAQAEADMAADLPPEEMHRPMHQLFARVDAPNLEGYILYQQSSMDGSENPAMIFRHGLMQYLPVEGSNVVRQRELYFKDAEPYKNAHRNPEILTDVTLDDVTWDEGCDFYLEANADGSKVAGPLLEGQCVMFNPGLQKDMYAEDMVEITATEYAFLGRFVDAEGNVLWGTASDDLNRMDKLSD